MKQHSKSVPESSSNAADAQHAQQVASAERREWLIDPALMDTFPASDPVSL